MSITTDQILSETIQIKSSDIFKTRNIDGIISHKLKKYEGKCTKNGYIVKDSIEIVNRSVGKIINIFPLKYRRIFIGFLNEIYDLIANNRIKNVNHKRYSNQNFLEEFGLS